VSSRPLSEEPADGYYVTADGYRARDCEVVDRGVLSTYLFSL